ncbi:zinc-ribbon domain-containing protein [Promethearchaeum syntrophicum]|uniref:Zinc-ribbon domain-containing protein n=1 Tax=Promethearchaeum syntrophicum TaxID=2594042 RepID=A0A5B9DD48_9ARCH|nr:zinc ribbon domain-containing protein [Candidatus Prometheoarchaeum syntrophicum]QEE16797.1 hypothetical protein DSAG12_02627 [Candidatus Prometheoarchaeum syntrophicum]
MICPECKSDINDNVKFCEYCGFELPIQPQQKQQYQQQLQYQQSPQYQQPQQIQPILNTINTGNNVVKLQIVHEKVNPRIRELEEKIEDYKNSGIFFIFCFYPVAIYLFIMRAKYKKELYFLKNPNELNNLNNPSNPNHPNYNLGWKTFGMWFLFYSISVLIWMSIESLMGTNPEDMFFSPKMAIVMIVPIILAYFWHKKHKVQVH